MILLDVFQDPVCPWCHLGKHYLAGALAATPAAVSVRQRAYLLNDRIPAAGVDYRTYMESVVGGPARLEAAWARLTQLGAAAGAAFNFGRIRFMPDSHLALRLIAGTPPAQQSVFTDRITQAYFEHGEDIGRLDVLLALAAEITLDTNPLRVAARDPATAAAVRDDVRRARALGVTGVPAAIVAGQIVVGAQPPEVWRRMLTQPAAL